MLLVCRFRPGPDPAADPVADPAGPPAAAAADPAAADPAATDPAAADPAAADPAAAGSVEAFLDAGRRAVALLSARPGCLDATLAEAADEPGVWLLVARFSSAAAYRRALSPFDVRSHVVPWLAQALTDEPSLYEPRVVGAGGEVTDVVSVIARDAGTVRLGEAAGPATAR